MIKTLVTLKRFGELCAVESAVAVTFLIATAICLHAEAIDGAVVALIFAGAAVGLGISRFRSLTQMQSAMTKEEYDANRAMSKEEYDALTQPKRNRAKPAPVKPRKVVKKGKARPKK